MEINFTKMHGLGNDFIVIDAVTQDIRLSPSQIRFLAQRQRGIGFDQCLIVEPTTSPDVDFNYRIFNADGGEVGQCGNGARCLAKFIHDKKLSDKQLLTVATSSRKLELSINKDQSITVNLGQPKFQPPLIPLANFEEQRSYTITYNDEPISFHALNLGNPHAVILVEDVNNFPVAEIVRAFGRNACFPRGVNIGFMQILDEATIRLRVVERGVGETQACGSGACAAMVCGRTFYEMAQNVTVELTGGELQVSWPGIGHPIKLTGPAVTVYDGTISL